MFAQSISPDEIEVLQRDFGQLKEDAVDSLKREGKKPAPEAPPAESPAPGTRPSPEPDGADSAKTAPPPQEPVDVSMRRKTKASVAHQPTLSENWFLNPKEFPNVHFSAKAGNQIVPLSGGMEIFASVAFALKAAKRSVDIITWGLDTDMRLVRAGNPHEYYRTEDYLGFYPARQYPMPPPDNWERGKSGPSGRGASPDPESWVFADLLTSLALRGVKIRLLVWEPNYPAQNVLDPLHFWFRCKTGIIPNIEFAFRTFEGNKTSRPPRPQLMVKGVDGTERPYRDGLVEKYEQRVDRLLSDPRVYNLLFTHHQKEIIVDLDLPSEAVGFIIGCNIKEEYWDSGDHKSFDEFRRPYRPWRDVGVKARGPVLADMAENFRESWEQALLEEKNPFAGGPAATAERTVKKTLDLTREAFPASLTGAALAAGLSPREVYNWDVLKRFDAAAYGRALGLSRYLKISSPAVWGNRLAPQCMELCACLTALSEIVYGVMRGGFDTEGMLRPASSWDGKTPKPKEFKTDDDALRHTAQFSRTFSLTDKPEDFSIRAAYSRALRSAQADGLIYIENQYFRDVYFVDEIVQLANRGVKPHIVIVTNPLSNKKGEFLNPGEGRFAEEPTYIAYQMLKENEIPFHFCWLRVTEQNPPVYRKPRGPSIVSGIVDALTMLKAGGMEMEHLFAKIISARNRLYEDVYPLLLEKEAAAGRGPFEEPDAGLNRRILWAIENFQAIKESFGEMKQYFDVFDKIENMLKAQMHNMAINAADFGKDVFLSALDKAIDEIHQRVREAEDARYWPTLGKKLKLMVERWTYHARDFLSVGDKPVFIPYQQGDRHISEICRRMDGLLNVGQPRPPDPDPLPGHIYVHSKVMIIDEAFALVGSANLNERSMWHDSETALSFHGNNRASPAKDMQRALFNIILKGNMPDKWTGQDVFKHFDNILKDNMKIYNDGNPHGNLIAHVLRFEPVSRQLSAAMAV
ncbi:MAG: hypothetical protein LBC94_08395 [Desulfovibrio sp.]|jgi:phosphatidylserine/phosphatidylglycerophosphate/cardiolipin synthase-like enzyme|nr:hypothetical protein [Desulfovibrio sp.]